MQYNLKSSSNEKANSAPGRSFNNTITKNPDAHLMTIGKPYTGGDSNNNDAKGHIFMADNQ